MSQQRTWGRGGGGGVHAACPPPLFNLYIKYNVLFIKKFFSANYETLDFGPTCQENAFATPTPFPKFLEPHLCHTYAQVRMGGGAFGPRCRLFNIGPKAGQIMLDSPSQKSCIRPCTPRDEYRVSFYVSPGVPLPSHNLIE